MFGFRKGYLHIYSHFTRDEGPWDFLIGLVLTIVITIFVISKWNNGDRMDTVMTAALLYLLAIPYTCWRGFCYFRPHYESRHIMLGGTMHNWFLRKKVLFLLIIAFLWWISFLFCNLIYLVFTESPDHIIPALWESIFPEFGVLLSFMGAYRSYQDYRLYYKSLERENKQKGE